MSLSDNTNNIRVSVIVPVYKVEGTLKAAVKSIQAQTYKNLEIILVDDGSPDKSGEICDHLALGDNRIRVIHKKNGGVSSVRNAGISQASSDFLCFVDSDDEIEPTMVEKLVKAQAHTGAQLVVAGVTEYHKKTIKDIYESDATIDFSNSTNEQIINLCSKSIMTFTHSKLFSKKIFTENNLFFKEGLVCGEDHLLIFQYLCCTEKISFICEPLYRYYCFNSNGATRFFPLSGQIAIFKAKESFLRKNGDEKTTNEYCAKNALRNLISRINYLAKRSIKDYKELGEAYDFYWPYIVPYLSNTDVFEKNDAVWLNKNRKLLVDKKIKHLYSSKKKEIAKNSKRNRNLKEFLNMSLKEKIKFLSSKLR